MVHLLCVAAFSSLYFKERWHLLCSPIHHCLCIGLVWHSPLFSPPRRDWEDSELRWVTSSTVSSSFGADDTHLPGPKICDDQGRVWWKLMWRRHVHADPIYAGSTSHSWKTSLHSLNINVLILNHMCKFIVFRIFFSSLSFLLIVEWYS